ncbi:hypothetical protein D3C85_1043930 [compost metagenome]
MLPAQIVVLNGCVLVAGTKAEFAGILPAIVISKTEFIVTFLKAESTGPLLSKTSTL